MNFTGPAGTPTSTSMIMTPPMPAVFIASMSAVIPSRFRFPSVQTQ